MMEVTQAVSPTVDFKDKIKANGVLSPTKLSEKKSEMDKLPEKSETLVKVVKDKDVSTPATVNGNDDIDEIFADDLDDPDLLNTEAINGEEEGDDMDILADDFLNDIEDFEADDKTVDETILEEEKSEDVLKKTEDVDVEQQKSENLVSSNVKDNEELLKEKPDNEELPLDNLDKEEENKETETQVETKTDGGEEMADLGEEMGDLNEEMAEEEISEKIENIKEVTRKPSTEKIDENESLPEAPISNSAVESRAEKRLCSIGSDTEKVTTNNEDPKSGDSEKIVSKEPISPPKSEKTPDIEEFKIKVKSSKDEQPDKAVKLPDCDIINLDSPMTVEDKEEKVKREGEQEKDKTTLSKSSQGESADSSELVEDNLVLSKRRRESRTSRGSRTSRESRESREGQEKSKNIQVNESPDPKRRKSTLKDNNLKEDDILFLNEKLEVEEEKEKSPIKDTESKEKGKDETAEEPKSSEKDDDVMLVDDKLDIEEEEIELILAKEKESSEGLKTKIAPHEKKLNENESDDDDVVFLEEENIETDSDSTTTISKNVNKEDEKNVEIKKSEDKKKEEKEVEKVKVEKSSKSKAALDKVGNDSDDDVVLLDDDLEENEAKKEKDRRDSASSKTDSSISKSDTIKRQDSLDAKSGDKKDKPATANETEKKVNGMDDDDDVVLLEVDDEKTTKKDDLKKIEAVIDKASNEENKENLTKKGELKKQISLDTSKCEKVDKVDAKVDEDDDEVVFMEEIKNTEKDQSKDPKDKAASAPSTRSSSRKSSKDADETDKSKSNAISPDNSDNAQDKFPDKSEEDTVNTDGDNNLLEEGKPPEICSNDEVSDLENSNEPISKQIKTGDDETSQSSLTLETESPKVEDVDRKSLKRSISGDPLPQESKKLKAENTEAVAEKKESDVLLIPRPPSTKPVDLSLDFLNRFKKSFTKMTKTDLEELVLQKIVEAIVHKSDMSDMRELIEKQDKIITTHRAKMAEITKQFRDLEMVHQRVVKDIETKNQQFIMPVKITRAVGLQVLIPKRIEQNGGSKTSTSSERAAAPSSSPSPAVSSNTIEMTKRKCSQKITPLRPDTAQSPMNRSFPPSLAHNGPNSSLVTNSPQQSSAPSTPPSKPLQKILPRTPAAPPIPQQNANTTQTAPAQYIIQQPSFSPAPTQALPAVRKSTNSLRSAAQPTVQRPGLTSQSSPDRPRVPPMILKKSGTNGQVLTVASPTNITVTPLATPPTPAPPNKSFIDLTDEDDPRPPPQANVLPALVAIPTAAQPATRLTYVVNKPNSGPQRVSVTQNSTNMTRMPAVRTRPPYAIAPKPAPIPQQAVAPIQSGPRMPATPAMRRSHPAPLPKSPPALSNPAWKAPPPRPAIRINNIDSGIVISWTMDEMTDQHAEVTSYQIYAYQETSAPPQVEAWRHVGDVKAMLLPMAVTLTQFQEGQRYYFAVRAVDMHSRCGPFSIPKTWS